MLNAVQRINIGTANMWGFAQIAIKVIAPRMIRAGDRPAQLLCFVNQNHAAMPANILEHIDIAILGAHHDHRNAQKGQWLYHASMGNILAKADRRPVIAEQGILFMLVHGLVNIAGIGQTVRALNRSTNITKIKH